MANHVGFSLHAGVIAEAHQRDKLERLCRYVSRPAVSEQRLALTSHGQVRYELKAPYRNGTTHVIFQPLDFIAKLAALVPKPRVNFIGLHGVFAPNGKHHGQITPAKRGNKTTKVQAGGADWLDKNPEERHRAMIWMQRLKRVFNIDIETCECCGGKVKVAAPAHPCARGISASLHVIASIEDPAVIAHILIHLKQKEALQVGIQPHELPPERAPPQVGLFDPSQSRLFD